MTRNIPMLGSVVGIVAIGNTFKVREFGLDGLDQIPIRDKFLHLPLVAVEWHVLHQKQDGIVSTKVTHGPVSESRDDLLQ